MGGFVSVRDGHFRPGRLTGGNARYLDEGLESMGVIFCEGGETIWEPGIPPPRGTPADYAKQLPGKALQTAPGATAGEQRKSAIEQ